MIVRNIGLISLAFCLLLAVPASASEISPKNVIKYVNEARQEAGLDELATSDKLTTIAKQKANDMVEHKYFAHTSPAGLTPWYWFDKNGYDYKYAGENLAINFKTAETEQKAWMDSPTHRRNILNASFNEIGVAVVAGEVNGQLGIIAVQEFGSLGGVPIGKSPKESFSVQKDSGTSLQETGLSPTVLSVRSLPDESVLQENLTKKIFGGEDNSMDRVAVLDGAHNFFMMLLLLTLLLPVIVLQLAFMTKYFQSVRRHFFPAMDYATVNVADPQAYLKELEEKKSFFDKLKYIKIIRSG